MCGITGFWDPHIAPEEGDRTLELMTGTLVHRGPDQVGTWRDPEVGLGLGHRRLSVVDLSATGNQPMTSPCGRYVVVFNGEIYNFRQLRRELEAEGHRFSGGSDTEVLVAAIARWGLREALVHCNGMFALAVWDRSRRKLSLARDRLGEKPVYYGWIAGRFLFGSELKAVRAHPAARLTIDPESVALFLRYGYVPAPRSIYREVRKLPPGSLVEISGPSAENATPSPYWSLEETVRRGREEPFSDSPEAAVEHLESLLRDAVAIRLEADVPVGALLSGGIDSSAVVSLVQELGAAPARTYSIGFTEAEFDEAAYAREVARHLGTEHTELYVTPAAAQAVVPELGRLYDEPFADSSQIPTLLVSRLARRDVTVALSGDGGDEVFAGYNRYLWAPRVWDRMAGVPMGARRMASRAISHVGPDRWGTLWQGLGPVLPRGWRVRTPAVKLQKLASVLTVGSVDEMYERLVSQWSDPSGLVAGLPADGPPGHGVPAEALSLGPVERMIFLDTLTYLPDDILTKVDRATMSVGLEARVPLLDHRLVEFAWRLPLDYKIRDGEGKWPLRRMLRRRLPSALFDRPKMGFAIPVGEWLRGPLRGWAESLLDPPRIRAHGLLNSAPIRQVWEEHLSGRHDHSASLWTVLIFQAWLETVDA